MKHPQISIRSLLWITAILAVALGWCIDRRRLEAKHQFTVRQMLAITTIRERALRKDLDQMHRQLVETNAK
jgi:hypothetical protein